MALAYFHIRNITSVIRTIGQISELLKAHIELYIQLIVPMYMDGLHEICDKHLLGFKATAVIDIRLGYEPGQFFLLLVGSALHQAVFLFYLPEGFG